MSGSDIQARREAILQERSGIAAEIARLQMRAEHLAREDERLRADIEDAVEPYLVSAKFLTAKLGISVSSLSRLVNNPAKGFPDPVFVDSDRRWKWHEVKAWLQ